MRALVQRVRRAAVTVDGDELASIGPGLLVLLGVRGGDGEAEVAYVADKLANLRIFADEDQKMNRSVLEVGGEVLLVSQFTLYADTRKGRRPDFTAAAPYAEAERLFERFREACEAELPGRVQSGLFGARMEVALVNDGPVTLVIDR